MKLRFGVFVEVQLTRLADDDWICAVPDIRGFHSRAPGLHEALENAQRAIDQALTEPLDEQDGGNERGGSRCGVRND